jgi:hypothetical protein
MSYLCRLSAQWSRCKYRSCLWDAKQDDPTVRLNHPMVLVTFTNHHHPTKLKDVPTEIHHCCNYSRSRSPYWVDSLGKATMSFCIPSIPNMPVLLSAPSAIIYCISSLSDYWYCVAIHSLRCDLLHGTWAQQIPAWLKLKQSLFVEWMKISLGQVRYYYLHCDMHARRRL